MLIQNSQATIQVKIKKTICSFVFMSFASCCFIANSYAEPGDELVVTGSIVNLRTAASTASEAALKLLQGRKVIEIQRLDDWVEIETGRSDIRTGWLHQSLVAKASEVDLSIFEKTEPEEVKLTIAEQMAKSDINRFEHFMQRFNDRNEVTIKQGGIIYFSDAKQNDDNAIKVIATEAWLTAEIEERQNTLSEVFKLWSDVVPVGSSITMKVFDEQGEQHMVMLR